jgi:hypothetical protein
MFMPVGWREEEVEKWKRKSVNSKTSDITRVQGMLIKGANWRC